MPPLPEVDPVVVVEPEEVLAESVLAALVSGPPVLVLVLVAVPSVAAASSPDGPSTVDTKPSTSLEQACSTQMSPSTQSASRKHSLPVPAPSCGPPQA